MKKLNKKGFTLVEVVVAVAILGIVAVMISSIFMNSQNIQLKSELQRQEIAKISSALQKQAIESGMTSTSGSVTLPGSVTKNYTCYTEKGVKLCMLTP